MPRKRTTSERHQKASLYLRWADIPVVAEGVRSGQQPAIDRAIAFLSEDPRFHGSGYEKERLWRRLAQITLSRKQQAALESAALQHLERRMTREFRSMAHAMASIATDAFWDEVKAAEGSPDRGKQRRAIVLAGYSDGVNAGDAARLRLGLG